MQGNRQGNRHPQPLPSTWLEHQEEEEDVEVAMLHGRGQSQREKLQMNIKQCYDLVTWLGASTRRTWLGLFNSGQCLGCLEHQIAVQIRRTSCLNGHVWTQRTSLV